MPLPQLIVTKTGRTLYKDAAGKWISKAKFDLLNRIDPRTGRFISAAQAARRGTLQSLESRLRSQLGAPPRGMNWVRIASKYPDRFADYLT